MIDLLQCVEFSAVISWHDLNEIMKLFRQVNIERSSNGLPCLQWDTFKRQVVTRGIEATIRSVQ